MAERDDSHVLTDDEALLKYGQHVRVGYEILTLERAFELEYKELCKKYQLQHTSCGCCGGIWIEEYHE